MCAHAASDCDIGLAPAGDVESIIGRKWSRSTSAPRGMWLRVTRFVGQLLVELPASTWLLLDVCMLTGLLCVAYRVFPPPNLEHTPHVELWQACPVFALGLVIASLAFGHYERDTIMSRSRILTRMLLAVGAATTISYAIIYVVMYATVSRRVTGFTMVFFLMGTGLVRLFACWTVHQLHRGLLVVGSRALLRSFQNAQDDELLSEYRLVGYVTTGEKREGDANDDDNLGTITEYIHHLHNAGVSNVVVGSDAARDPAVMDWVVPCLQQGCRVTNEAIFYEKATGQILVDEITPNWFLFADLKVHCDEHATVKRLFDLATTIIGLCLSAPLWPLIALAVKLNDGGPVFYAQDRVGQNGQIFRLYKFRTMKPNSENGKSIWASPNDPRTTRVGRFLRRTRFDELPQLYNILAGQMSVVGRRPERPDIVRELSEKLPYSAERQLVEPGLSGWAQISFRYGASIEDAKRKLQFDLYYLKHMSFELDMMILFRTVGTFLKGAC